MARPPEMKTSCNKEPIIIMDKRNLMKIQTELQELINKLTQNGKLGKEIECLKKFQNTVSSPLFENLTNIQDHCHNLVTKRTVWNVNARIKDEDEESFKERYQVPMSPCIRSNNDSLTTSTDSMNEIQLLGNDCESNRQEIYKDSLYFMRDEESMKQIKICLYGKFGKNERKVKLNKINNKFGLSLIYFEDRGLFLTAVINYNVKLLQNYDRILKIDDKPISVSVDEIKQKFNCSTVDAISLTVHYRPTEYLDLYKLNNNNTVFYV